MKKESLKKILHLIISDEDMCTNEKIDNVIDLFENEELSNMQYYMEYCNINGYVSPKTWLTDLKHF